MIDSEPGVRTNVAALVEVTKVGAGVEADVFPDDSVDPLTGVELTGVELTGVELTGVELTGVELTGVGLQGDEPPLLDGVPVEAVLHAPAPIALTARTWTE
jgi:uncharacterized protein YjbI with pentapeptide repeats